MDITKHALQRLKDRFDLDSSHITNIKSILNNKHSYTRVGHKTGAKEVKFRYRGAYMVAVIRDTSIVTFKWTDKDYHEKQKKEGNMNIGKNSLLPKIDLGAEKTMTVKEVAEALGVSKDLITKRLKELFPNKHIEPRKTLHLDEYEVSCISARIKENSSLISIGDDRRQLVKTPLEKQLIIKQAMTFLNETIDNLEKENTQLRIELDQEKAWYSVKRIKSLGYLPDISVHNIWRPLKKWCLENNQQIKTITDANYGDVKTYHADAWKGVYKLDLAYNNK